MHTTGNKQKKRKKTDINTIAENKFKKQERTLQKNNNNNRKHKQFDLFQIKTE